ncbi:XylR N-terminal domain-containing protein [Pseudogracilibacillus sp. SO30301A]|uniref:XylR N-terminal domain-containing protein n=1 Tax=Pseudogracilibacillus sp. SO30301A TaxID=3098291 RepID=UPI00300DCF8F
MKADQLVFENLIDLNPTIGKISFNDKRMSLVSTEALGLFRRDLINTLGMERTKGFLMRYGWACGVRDGREIASMYHWDSIKELMLAGPVLHTLLGVVTANPDKIELDEDYLCFTGTWENSYEALEHISHYGHSEDNGCWTLVGYASGYLTETFGKDVIAYESQCIGRGDPICRFVAKTLDVYDTQANKMMKYYKADSIDRELNRIQKELYEINQNIIESDKVHQQLTNFLVEDKDIQETTSFIANILNKSIVIDYYNNIIESAFVKEADKQSYTNWTDKFVYKEEKKNEIRTFPIRTNNVNLGRLVVISKEKMTNRDELIINRALSIFTVQMYHQWKITQSLWKKKENFFEEMLNNTNVSQSHFEKFTHLFHFHPNQLNRILSIKIKSKTKLREAIQYLKVNYLLGGKDYFINNDNIIIILSEEEAENPKSFSYNLLEDLKEKFQNTQFYLGIGRCANNLSLLRESYQDASSLSEFNMLTNPTKSHISSYEDMGSIMMFLKGVDQKELIGFYKRTIGEIIRYDEFNKSDYLMTLKTYLDFNGNLQQTADRLHLSIAGLRYRMERIESFCGIDLKTGEGRFNCQLALQIHFAISLRNEQATFG